MMVAVAMAVPVKYCGDVTMVILHSKQYISINNRVAGVSVRAMWIERSGTQER